MATKYLVVDNIEKARQANEQALRGKYPNRNRDQRRRYPNDPTPQPRGLCPVRQAPDGRCEIEIDDSEVAFFGATWAAMIIETRTFSKEITTPVDPSYRYRIPRRLQPAES